MISGPDVRFIESRMRMGRVWRYVGTAALVVIAGFAGYLFAAVPLLINPFHAIEQIEADAVPNGTMVLMAAMTPLVFLALLFLMAVFVLFVFIAFANERRLLGIIDALRGRGDETRD